MNHKADNEGDIILNFLNYKKIEKLVSEYEFLLRKCDSNFRLPKLIIKYDNRPNTVAAIKQKANKWFLKINKKTISTEDLLKYGVLHECIHYWIGNDLDSGIVSCPDDCPCSSNVNCFQDNKNCSLRLRLYCLLFQKTKLEPNIKLTRVGTHNNKYISFEEVIVDFAIQSIQPHNRDITYKLNPFEKDILSLLKPYMPNLPVALNYLFENYKI
jgi:hypothetical protein